MEVPHHGCTISSDVRCKGYVYLLITGDVCCLKSVGQLCEQPRIFEHVRNNSIVRRLETCIIHSGEGYLEHPL